MAEKIKLNLDEPDIKIRLLDKVIVVPPMEHKDLQGLDYENSGHTGFASEKQLENYVPKKIDELEKQEKDFDRTNTLLYVLSNEESKHIPVSDLIPEIYYNDEKLEIVDNKVNINTKDLINQSEKGVPNGVAVLDDNGKINSSQLPSYVDDVLNGYLFENKFYKNEDQTEEYTPEKDKIYVDLKTNNTYRWSGLEYIEISKSLALGDTETTAFPGSRGKQLEEKAKENEIEIDSLESRIHSAENTLNSHTTDLENIEQEYTNFKKNIAEDYVAKTDFDSQLELSEFYKSSEDVQNREITSLSNDKQDKLESGVNIKTVNGSSLLEGGNLELVDKKTYDTEISKKQEKLVSGVNIKTINDESILGEGNIEISIPTYTFKTINKESILGEGDFDLVSKNDFESEVEELNGLKTSKQDTLVSGTNIKQINGLDLLGSGNLSTKDLGAYTTEEIDNKESALQEKINTAISNSNEAKLIAEGRSKAVVFDTISDMQSNLSKASNTEYKVGDNLFIKQENVPDYWISGVLEDNAGYYGYYEISILETQKVDLTEYQKKTDETLNTEDKSIVGGINENKSNISLLNGVIQDIPNTYVSKESYSQSEQEQNDIIAQKQDTLVNQTNIKSINGVSILGSGDLEIPTGEKEIETLNGKVKTLEENYDVLSSDVETNTATIQTLNDKAKEIDNKQDKLVSGETLKTINGESLLGEGNIIVSGGGKDYDTDIANLKKTSVLEAFNHGVLGDSFNINLNDAFGDVNQTTIIDTTSISRPGNLSKGVRQTYWLGSKDVVCMIVGRGTNNEPCIWIANYDGSDWHAYRQVGELRYIQIASAVNTNIIYNGLSNGLYLLSFTVNYNGYVSSWQNITFLVRSQVDVICGSVYVKSQLTEDMPPKVQYKRLGYMIKIASSQVLVNFFDDTTGNITTNSLSMAEYYLYQVKYC